ncbi:hypothetical protein CVT26_001883 [Gymnopilus dilepis]|uniref:Uncharacterized protein n=1 Tax=Gymnopilus dilepis TaxID=231916 RepID=A0A409Y3X3_9AGAR|nr:hypothetical protein CVT26_001883 [Gymnopilus dilepis]
MPLTDFIRHLNGWNADIYSFSGSLKGHKGAVNALAFNNNGSLLASGGDDEQVRIWDITAFRQCQNLMNSQGRWGQITCLNFINFENSLAVDWLCFGTGRGIISIYRKSRRAAEFVEAWSLSVFSAGDSVEAFSFDPVHQRLAVGSHYGQIKLLRCQNGKFVEVWQDELRDAIPRAILFSDNGRSVNIFTLETGAICTRDAETSATVSTRILKTPIGHVAQCHSTGNLLVDNIQNGFDLYAPNRASPIRTFRIELSRKFVKAGVFCEGGKTIACGSDHGRAYVFASGEDQVKQELIHGGRQDLIQAIKATTTNGFHIIVSGASTGNWDIDVWKKPVKGRANRGEKRQILEALIAMNMILMLAFLWMTRDAWGNNIKAVRGIRSSSDSGIDDYAKKYDNLTKKTFALTTPRPALHRPVAEGVEEWGSTSIAYSVRWVEEPTFTPLVQKIEDGVNDEPGPREFKTTSPSSELAQGNANEINLLNGGWYSNVRQTTRAEKGDINTVLGQLMPANSQRSPTYPQSPRGSDL